MSGDVQDLMLAQYADLVDTANRLRASCIKEDGTPIVLIKQDGETIRNPYLDEYHWTCDQIRNLERKIPRPGGARADDDDDAADGSHPVGTAAIADVLGVTQRRIQQLCKDGVLPHERRGSQIQFNLRETCKAYIAYLNDRLRKGGAEPSSDDLTRRKLVAEVEYREAKAEAERLKTRQIRGELHDARDVKAATDQLVQTAKTMLVAMPSRLSVDVTAAKTAPESSQIIGREVNRILTELSRFRYDPETYRRMLEGDMGESDDD